MTNWNDLPVKNYDFEAPLGAYGQIRPHYALLARLHSFLRDYGAELAECDVALPALRPQGKDDLATLRWSVRSDGARGFLFVNNHERGRTLPAHRDVRFAVNFASGSALTLPSQPISIPSGARFIWPLNLPLAPDATLAWATVQPLARTTHGSRVTHYFFAQPGVAIELALRATKIAPREGITTEQRDGLTLLHVDSASRRTVCTINDSIDLVVLAPEDSLQVRRTADGGVSFAVPPEVATTVLRAESIRAADAARTIALGLAKQPVAAAPVDRDFAQAALWRIKLPESAVANDQTILRLHYRGDVARVRIGGALITDDFYHGAPLEIGLHRHRTALAAANHELEIAILPLRRDAVEGPRPLIYLAPEHRPDFSRASEVAELLSAELAAPIFPTAR